MSLARLSLVQRRQSSGLRPAALLAAQRRRLAAPPSSGVPPPAAPSPDRDSQLAAVSRKINKSFASPRVPESSFYAPGRAPPTSSLQLDITTTEREGPARRPKRPPVKTFIGSSPASLNAARAEPKPDPFVALQRRRQEMIERAQRDPSLARAASRMERLERPFDPDAAQALRTMREAVVQEVERTGPSLALPPTNYQGRAALRAARRQESASQAAPEVSPRPAADRVDAGNEAAAPPTDRAPLSRFKVAQKKERDDDAHAASSGADVFTFKTELLDALSAPDMDSTSTAMARERGARAGASSASKTFEFETLEEDTVRERPPRRPRAATPAAQGVYPLPHVGTRTGVDLFLGLGVRQEIVDGLRQHFPHVSEPTKFQKQLLSKVALGMDMIAQQSTGQGKTLTALLSLLSLERRPRKAVGDKGRPKAQSTALFVVSSAALAKQVMAWAALLIKPEDLASTIELFDPSSPTSFATGRIPPLIVLATPDALHPEHVGPMRARCLRTIVLDEADRIIWPTETSSKIKGNVVETIEKMLRNAVVNAPSSIAPHRRKPQFVVLGSTISPRLMDWLRNHREWVAPNAIVTTQGASDHDTAATAPRLMQSGELPTDTTYHSPALNRQAHHLIVVAPSGKLRNLSSPPPPERDLEPAPATEKEIDSFLLDAFVALHRSAQAASSSEQSLLVLKDQAAVEDAQRHLAGLGLDAQPVTADTTTPLPSSSSRPAPSFPSPEPAAEEPSTGAFSAAQQPARAVLLTDVRSCRGLDIPSLTTVYTTAGAISSEADYVHIAGRLARLGSATFDTRGRVVTLVPGDTQEKAEEKADRLATMSAWLKRRETGEALMQKHTKARKNIRKRKGDLAWNASTPEERAAFVAETFAPVNSELEKVKFALATLKAESEDLPLPSIS